MPLLQLVPSRVCLSCDVCCRFPEPESFLRPYFTTGEIRQAVAQGMDPARFSDPNGCQVTVVPHPSGEGYLCPAFDPATSHCRIYEHRPIDCQIYPLAVMWNADRSAVVLGWDTKCPFLKPGDRRWAIGDGQESSPLPMAHDPLPGLRAYADKITELLEREDMLDTVASNPRLVGRFQEDVVVLNPLPKLTEKLVRTDPQWSPLTPADHDRFRQALACVDTPLAHYALAPHLIWNDLFRYSWTEIAGCLCLFAEYGDGVFMPLPPLELATGHEARGTRQEQGPMARGSRLAAAIAACFRLMRERNRGSAVSRIENVPEAWKASCESWGYRVKPKDPDYLYRTADLVALAGDNYKSQRAACNRFEREQHPSFASFQESDRDGCAQLCREWVAQKQATGEDAVARQMLADSEAAHREALARSRELGLTGHVVRVDGRIRAYTFGYERSPSVFCVLLEVADRSIPGLAAWIFRERCRLAAEQGYEFINTMDDSGLPSLAQSKRAYHPVQLVPSYIVTEA